MKKFINDDFLLLGDSAKKLYFDYAAALPIIDFHSHLDASEAASDKRWENISQLWLAGDHYKWRAMRSNGIPEKFCTGSASDKEKFFAFAETMPKLIRNPIYHWCHLELARYFDIDDVLLSPETAEEVWVRANSVIEKDFSARKCLEKSNVEIACTTDDPTASLSSHAVAFEEWKGKKLSARILPTFRPDKALAFEKGAKYADYIKELSEVSGVNISSFSDLMIALRKRHKFFEKHGCRSSDYGMDTMHFVKNFPSEHLDEAFNRALEGDKLSPLEISALKSEAFLECARMDADAGWVRQLHIGPMRDNNSKMFALLGGDAGFDSIGESNYALSLSMHLDALNSEGKLGRTILYNIHPKDTEMLASMLGNFQDDSCGPAKMQLGSGWWFLDQMDGMKRQIEAMSAMSLLPRFVGMLTDSRSFLSYSRHEYFRRILCAILGAEMDSGILPYNFELIGGAVADISYHNAKNYFNY